MKAIIYTRVSTPNQKENGFSLQDQEIRLRKYCHQKNYEIIGHYQDDFSAKDFNRPEFQKLITNLVSKQVKADKLLCIDADRFSRCVEEALIMFTKLSSLGIEVEFVEGGLDSKTPEGKFMRNFKLALAEFDNDLKSKRTKSGMRQAMREGRWVNSPPKGYSMIREEGKSTLVKNKDATFIEQAFKKVAIGVNDIEVVRKQLRKLGFSCSKAHFYNILKNVAYTGKIRIPVWQDDEEIIVDGLHEPIIDNELFDQVQSVLYGKKKRHDRSYKFVSELILRGHLVCPECGKKLTGSGSLNPIKNRYFYYHCQNGCKTRFNADVTNKKFYEYLESIKVPDEIINLYVHILDDVFKKNNLEQESKIYQVNKEIERINTLINSTEDKFMDDLIDQITYNRLKKRYEDKKDELLLRRLDLKIAGKEVTKYIEFALPFLSKLHVIYQKVSVEIKHKILGSIFPENLVYDGKKYRTHKLNEVLALLSTKFKESEMLKVKKTAKYSGQSYLAPQPGLEPGTY